jgi:hypothetical protein
VDFGGWLFDWVVSSTAKAITDAQPYSRSKLVFPYTFGSLRAYDAWHIDGHDGIAAFYSAPPAATQQVIAHTLVKDQPQDALETLSAPVLDPLKLDSDDVLGAWGILLFATKEQLTLANAGTLAAAWRADHLWAYTDHTNQPTYALWEIELGDEQSATELDGALEQASMQASRAFTHGVMGTRVFASAGYADPSDDSVTAAGTAWLSGN